MRRSRLTALVVAAAFTVVAAVAAPLPARTSEAQMVGVTITPKDLPASGEWQFEVTMNTHVTPLEDDLAASAMLVDGQGRTYAPLAWRGDGPGAHHRKGVLAFAPITPRRAAIELRSQRRGEATPRSFKWTLPAQ
ncbi:MULTISPECIES: hypothetical protein [Ramlibacter]|uniref:Uncharacterized protein n=1 Tax=Ramlibacter aquaticus TaxID=2780094 RepID=A0ABR9SFN3_9BURK|nr:MULTISPECIES: hypothetical protein [Ramlibacter]MBE7940714.1 hypothetical protein [Ramlibacter aquaticus]